MTVCDACCMNIDKHNRKHKHSYHIPAYACTHTTHMDLANILQISHDYALAERHNGLVDSSYVCEGIEAANELPTFSAKVCLCVRKVVMVSSFQCLCTCTVLNSHIFKYSFGMLLDSAVSIYLHFMFSYLLVQFCIS